MNATSVYAVRLDKCMQGALKKLTKNYDSQSRALRTAIKLLEQVTALEKEEGKVRLITERGTEIFILS